MSVHAFDPRPAPGDARPGVSARGGGADRALRLRRLWRARRLVLVRTPTVEATAALLGQVVRGAGRRQGDDVDTSPPDETAGPDTPSGEARPRVDGVAPAADSTAPSPAPPGRVTAQVLPFPGGAASGTPDKGPQRRRRSQDDPPFELVVRVDGRGTQPLPRLLNTLCRLAAAADASATAIEPAMDDAANRRPPDGTASPLAGAPGRPRTAATGRHAGPLGTVVRQLATLRHARILLWIDGIDDLLALADEQEDARQMLDALAAALDATSLPLHVLLPVRSTTHRWLDNVRRRLRGGRRAAAAAAASGRSAAGAELPEAMAGFTREIDAALDRVVTAAGRCGPGASGSVAAGMTTHADPKPDTALPRSAAATQAATSSIDNRQPRQPATDADPATPANETLAEPRRQLTREVARPPSDWQRVQRHALQAASVAALLVAGMLAWERWPLQTSGHGHPADAAPGLPFALSSPIQPPIPPAVRRQPPPALTLAVPMLPTPASPAPTLPLATDVAGPPGVPRPGASNPDRLLVDADPADPVAGPLLTRLLTAGGWTGSDATGRQEGTPALRRYDLLADGARAYDGWRVVAPVYAERYLFVVRADSVHEPAAAAIGIETLRGRHIAPAVPSAQSWGSLRAVYRALFGAPLPGRASPPPHPHPPDDGHPAARAIAALQALADGGTAAEALVLIGVDPLAAWDALPPSVQARLRLVTLHDTPAARRALHRYLALPASRVVPDGPRVLAAVSFLVEPAQAGHGAALATALCAAWPEARRHGHPAWRDLSPAAAWPLPLPPATGSADALRACAADRPAPAAQQPPL